MATREKTIEYRQRRWRKIKSLECRCTQCGGETFGTMICDSCAKLKGVKRRYRTKDEWSTVDWSFTRKEIGILMGVTGNAVDYQRKKLTR